MPPNVPGNSFFDFHAKVTRQRRDGPRAAVAATMAAVPAGTPGPAPLTVSQLTRQIDGAIKSGLPGTVFVKGEVSNYHVQASSGHHYLTLKDAGACIDAVIWRDDARSLKFTPQHGLEVVAGGRVSVYGQRGKYQLYINTLQPVGQGALELAFRQLREKLGGEGLFAAERKRPLPPYPRRVVLITSRHTAALQDILKVLRRTPWLKLSLYHVPVQGDAAGRQIAAAIAHINQELNGRRGTPPTPGAERSDAPDSSDGAGGVVVGAGRSRTRREPASGADLILLARGGGSLEDLWCFNDEAVARAFGATGIPVGTVIGHEVDVSIADLVADYHAHTPTEAAQVIAQHWRLAAGAVETATLRVGRGVSQLVADARRRLANVERHETFRRPLYRVFAFRQLLDDREKGLALGFGGQLRTLHDRLSQAQCRLDAQQPALQIARLCERLRDSQRRLHDASFARLEDGRHRIDRAAAVLAARHPRHRLRLDAERLASLADRLQRSTMAALTRRAERLASLARNLEAIGPEQVLRRGFTLTMRKKDGRIVRSVAEIRPGDRLVTRFADGQVESVVDDATQPRLFE